MPNLIPSGATALEVIADAISAWGYGTLGEGLFLGIEVDGPVDSAEDDFTPDAAVFVTEGEGIPDLTMGTAIALENPTITVTVRGQTGDYVGPKNIAMDIRYKVAALADYTSRGVRVLTANPLGSLLPLGPDTEGRHRMTVKFNVTTDPSYV